MIVSSRLQILGDWKNVHSQEPIVLANRSIITKNWDSPMQCMLKCNVDASIHNHSDCSTYAAIIRHVRYSFLMGMTDFYGCILPIKLAEALALREFLFWI